MKFTCIDELNVYSSNHRKLIKRSVLRGERLDEDCKRMNEEIDRLNNKLEEKKQNETESEKEKT